MVQSDCDDILNNLGEGKKYQGFSVVSHNPKFYESINSLCASQTLKDELPTPLKQFGNDSVVLAIGVSMNWWMIVAIIELGILIFLIFVKK